MGIPLSGATLADIVLLTSPLLSYIECSQHRVVALWFLGGIGVFLLLFLAGERLELLIRLALILAVVGAN
ncbi:MAG: hypothetical protein R3D26_15390 [Cyanobacteriota/Melainabacteria group bacterium]